MHVSQISNERVDKPSQLFQVGDELEAEVTNIDGRGDRPPVKAPRRTEERDEMNAYLEPRGQGRSSPRGRWARDLQRAVAGDKGKSQS